MFVQCHLLGSKSLFSDEVYQIAQSEHTCNSPPNDVTAHVRVTRVDKRGPANVSPVINQISLFQLETQSLEPLSGD